MGGELESICAAYEQAGVPGLERELAGVRDAEPWLDALVRGATDPRAAVPATWFLRALLQRGVELDRDRTRALLRGLARVKADDARLHLCQSVTHLDVPARNAEQLARFLRAGAQGEHKLVRAWAVDGLHRLALQHDRYRAEARRATDRAARDPAASVRARARRIAAERD